MFLMEKHLTTNVFDGETLNSQIWRNPQPLGLIKFGVKWMCKCMCVYYVYVYLCVCMCMYVVFCGHVHVYTGVRMCMCVYAQASLVAALGPNYAMVRR